MLAFHARLLSPGPCPSSALSLVPPNVTSVSPFLRPPLAHGRGRQLESTSAWCCLLPPRCVQHLCLSGPCRAYSRHVINTHAGRRGQGLTGPFLLAGLRRRPGVLGFCAVLRAEPLPLPWLSWRGWGSPFRPLCPFLSCWWVCPPSSTRVTAQPCAHAAPAHGCLGIPSPSSHTSSQDESSGQWFMSQPRGPRGAFLRRRQL